MGGDVRPVCVVPARIASTRFPSKLLQDLGGAPVIVRTLQRAEESEAFSDVFCLTEDSEILDLINEWGFKGLKSGRAVSGTDRIARFFPADYGSLIVNLQGDEPLMPLENLHCISNAICAAPDLVHTLYHPTPFSHQEFKNPNRAAVLLDTGDRVVDFSRVPNHQNLFAGTRYMPHMGLYAYSRDYLNLFSNWPISKREKEEALELLRRPEETPLLAHPANGASIPIDVPDDLEAARAALTLELKEV